MWPVLQINANSPKKAESRPLNDLHSICTTPIGFVVEHPSRPKQETQRATDDAFQFSGAIHEQVDIESMDVSLEAMDDDLKAVHQKQPFEATERPATTLPTLQIDPLTHSAYIILLCRTANISQALNIDLSNLSSITHMKDDDQVEYREVQRNPAGDEGDEPDEEAWSIRVECECHDLDSLQKCTRPA